MSDIQNIIIPGEGALRMLKACKSQAEAIVLHGLIAGNGEVNTFVATAESIAQDLELSVEDTERALKNLQEGEIISIWQGCIILNPEIVANTAWTKKDAELVAEAYCNGRAYQKMKREPDPQA